MPSQRDHPGYPDIPGMSAHGRAATCLGHPPSAPGASAELDGGLLRPPLPTARASNAASCHHPRSRLSHLWCSETTDVCTAGLDRARAGVSAGMAVPSESRAGRTPLTRRRVPGCAPRPLARSLRARHTCVRGGRTALCAFSSNAICSSRTPGCGRPAHARGDAVGPEDAAAAPYGFTVTHGREGVVAKRLSTRHSNRSRATVPDRKR